MLEFGERDNHTDFSGEIISRSTIEQSLDGSANEAYRVFYNGRKVGGVVLTIDKETNHNIEPSPLILENGIIIS